MNLLEQIIGHKKIEVASRKRAYPVNRLMLSSFFDKPAHSFTGSIRDKHKTGIIAEFKRRSPSKGMINAEADVLEVTAGYTASGASALSVLTDEDFFGGGSHDFDIARSNEGIPLLRKDFIIDEYQVVEARAMGTDVILLIAAALTPAAVQQLSRLAKSLQLQVILEVHSREELDHLGPDIDAVGVNNRNLKTFTTNLQHSVDLYPYLPPALLKLSESGIRTAADIQQLRDVGFDGFLIGSLFMKEKEPHRAFADFVKTLQP